MLDATRNVGGVAYPSYPYPYPRQAPTSSTGAIVAAVFVGLWAVAVTVVVQAVGWVIEQVLLVTGLPTPGWIWLIAVWVNALLVGVPAVLIAAIPRSQSVRATGRAWLYGSVALGVLGSVRALPDVQHELYLAVLAVAAAGLALLFNRFVRRPATPTAGRRDAIGFAVAGGLASLVPWLWVGALGGILETVLSVAAGAAVGWLASTILDPGIWGQSGAARQSAEYQPVPGRGRLVVVGGLVAGVALLLIGAGVAGSGSHLAEMLVLPPLGFALAGLQPLASGRGAWPARWLIGLAALGPLAFVDNEEVTLLLFGRDIPLWALIAAGSSLAVGLLLGLAYAFALVRGAPTRPTPVRRWVPAATVAVLLAAGAGVYAGLGQPGLFGEKLFVVMRDQADLSSIDTSGGGQARRDQRARATYQLLVRQADDSQASLRKELRRLHLSYTPYYLVNGLEVEGGPGVRAWLSRRDDVDRVLISQQLRPLPAALPTAHGPDPAPDTPQWDITMLGADRVWSQLNDTGAGIVVGTSDSGVDGAHPALAGGFRGGTDSWYDPVRHTRTPTDTQGHGTHTLASAVGRTGTGVAPGAQWVGCVNLYRNLGNPARYLDCLQFMFAPFPPGGDPFTDGRPERAPQVLTNSWGCPRIEGCDEGALRQAAAALTAAGIFAVVAAGNTGPFCGSVADPPAVYPDVLTVGAVDRNGDVAQFSSRGPTDAGAVKPDVVAPGVDVLSAMPGGGYARLDGTSMATPHVAGVVALMWSANPALIGDLARTRGILRSTARPAQPTYLSHDTRDGCRQRANITGAGVVDAFAAVQAARAATAAR
jgi:subtilisin family serine protease